MADDEVVGEEQIDTTIPEMWMLAKPQPPHVDEEEMTEEQKKQAEAAAGGPKVGKLIKYLNDIEDPEEFETKLQERDPATNHSLLLWATLTGKFVVVEWLIKKGKRSAFAFTNDKKEMTVYEKWAEIRKEIEEREREKLLNPPEEGEAEAGEDDEEKEPEPTPEQLVYEGLAEYHEEWGDRANCVVKSIGELGVYQGHRDEEGTKCGIGQTLFPDGDMYTGEYQDNQRHGVGTYYWSNHGMLYCGQWNRNQRHGVGRMVLADGSRYYGAWSNDKINGAGRYTYPDGSTYNGAWVNGVKQGDGVYTFPDGSKYCGTFVDGEFVSGEWILGASGTRYVGRFHAGAPVGKGVFVFKSREGGTYRQEGEYVNGKWCPGPVSSKGTAPEVELVVQRKAISIGFTSECAALSTEDLVRAVNFAPFREWLDAVEANSSFFINGLSIAALHFVPATRNVSQLALKVNAVDTNGRSIRGLDNLVFKRATTLLLLVLTDGDRTIAVVEQTTNAAAQKAEELRLPAVEPSTAGSFGGRFLETVSPALRVNVSVNTTMKLPIDMRCDAQRNNATQNVIAYIQTVHPDTITTAQSRLDEQLARSNDDGFGKLRAVRLEDVGTMTSDATSLLAANYLHNLALTGKLPQATAEPQRPPTPIPPAIEERPDIEPLLEAERAKNKSKEEEADE